MKSKQSSNTDDFIEKSHITHGCYYDYSFSVYKNNRTPVVIVCPKHGKFYQTPEKHLGGKGCYKCGRIRCAETLTKFNNKEFMTRSVAVHGNNYDYGETEVSSVNCKVKIKCAKHGVFRQSAYKHMSGQGCPKCAKHGFNTNKEGYLYVLVSHSLEFMKIGISNNPSVRIRQLKNATPFTFDILEMVKGEGTNILALEKSLHKFFINAKLSGFDGCTEWFKFDITIKVIVK